MDNVRERSRLGGEKERKSLNSGERSHFLLIFGRRFPVLGSTPPRESAVGAPNTGTTSSPREARTWWKGVKVPISGIIQLRNEVGSTQSSDGKEGDGKAMMVQRIIGIFSLSSAHILTTTSPFSILQILTACLPLNARAGNISSNNSPPLTVAIASAGRSSATCASFEVMDRS